MPLSGLDPSMLLGFLCKDWEDWEDFRRRVVEVSLCLGFGVFFWEGVDNVFVFVAARTKP